MGLFRIFMPKQLPADNCRQTTTTAEKSNYQKGKPDYPADDSTIYAEQAVLNNPLNKYVPFYNKLLFLPL